MNDHDEMDVINRPDFVRHSGLPDGYFARRSLMWPLAKGIAVGVLLVLVLDWLFARGAL